MQDIEDKKTEQWALEEEKREQEWQEAYGGKAGHYVQEINELLAQGTRESRCKIKGMFLEPSFFQHYKQVDIFAVMYVVISIYELEDAAGLTQTILEQSDTMEGLQDYIFRFRMLIYRMDFEIGAEVEKEFLGFIREHRMSPIQLGVMITTSAMRPLPLALKLEKLFEKYEMTQYLLFIWGFVEDHWKGNFRILSRMADFHLKSGNQEMAKHYQSSVPGLPEKWKAQEHVVFQVQELLWKVLYKTEEAEEELASFLRREKVSDDIWKFLLGQMNAGEKEYYLCVVNILLECGLTDKAKMTLQSGLEAAPGDELILCLLAEQAINKGDAECAQEYLMEVVNPGKLTMQFQELCRRK